MRRHAGLASVAVPVYMCGGAYTPSQQRAQLVTQNSRISGRNPRKTALPKARSTRSKTRRGGTRPSVHVSIDVPDLKAGLKFYAAVFDFVELARPFPTMAILDANNVTVCMHEKPAGTKPSPNGKDLRRYERHWTPVHVDLHVQDFDGVLEKVKARGGLIEMLFRDHGPKPAAFCSDPFGNGFCVIGDSDSEP